MVEVKKINLPKEEINSFVRFVKKYRGVDLSSYSEKFLARRLNFRFGVTGVYNVSRYIGLLKRKEQEWNNFLDALSINVSKFFRDPEVFFYFKNRCLPELIKRKKERGEKTLRCWSCGCSCGEEAYSLAITCKEFFRKRKEEYPIKIFATDIDEDALGKAKKGVYSKSALINVEDQLLKRYFTPMSESVWCVKEEIKKLIIFRKHNFLMDRPLRFMDVVFFRNVNIYFNGYKREEIFSTLSQALKKGGYLVLGKVELLPFTLKEVFESTSVVNKIFKKA